jgi:hypothetical protein
MLARRTESGNERLLSFRRNSRLVRLLQAGCNESLRFSRRFRAISFPRFWERKLLRASFLSLRLDSGHAAPIRLGVNTQLSPSASEKGPGRPDCAAIQTQGEGAGASRWRPLDAMRETQARIDSFSGSTRLIAFRELVPGTARLDSSSATRFQRFSAFCASRSATP